MTSSIPFSLVMISPFEFFIFLIEFVICLWDAFWWKKTLFLSLFLSQDALDLCSYTISPNRRTSSNFCLILWVSCKTIFVWTFPWNCSTFFLRILICLGIFPKESFPQAIKFEVVLLRLWTESSPLSQKWEITFSHSCSLSSHNFSNL